MPLRTSRINRPPLVGRKPVQKKKKTEFEATNEMGNIQNAIKWGTNYFLKTSSRKNKLYVEVGDPIDDHHCWAPPENMKIKRTVKSIDSNTPAWY